MAGPSSQAPGGQQLTSFEERFAVCRIPPECPIPAWASSGSWWSLSGSPNELSVVCEERLVPEGVVRSGPWRVLRIEGPLDHAMVGVLVAVVSPLAAAQVPIFAISTYDTDYVLVPESRLGQACRALVDAGHQVAE
jgi:hypothetical protein